MGGRQERDGARCNSLEILGNALRPLRPEEALPVLEANLALNRRYWSHDEQAILCAQSSLANCLAELGRESEALALRRAIHAKEVATFGISHEDTILGGSNIVVSL